MGAASTLAAAFVAQRLPMAKHARSLWAGPRSGTSLSPSNAGGSTAPGPHAHGAAGLGRGRAFGSADRGLRGIHSFGRGDTRVLGLGTRPPGGAAAGAAIKATRLKSCPPRGVGPEIGSGMVMPNVRTSIHPATQKQTRPTRCSAWQQEHIGQRAAANGSLVRAVRRIHRVRLNDAPGNCVLYAIIVHCLSRMKP